MKRLPAWFPAALAAVSALALLPGCKTTELLTQAGTAVGVATGRITPQQAESITRSASAVGKAFENLTPEQEYYIGRSVAATLLATYTPYDKEAATLYLNTLGQALALSSDRPETFGGWHFLIMDTDEINAFAAPGGFILVSRGMLRCCRNEDELAAVLAHEIGHIQMRHGMKAIQKARMAEALTILAREGVKTYGDEEMKKLTENFGDTISDITTTMINNGYSRSYEYEADAVAINILRSTGYQPGALVNMLQLMGRQLMGRQLKPGGMDFAKTHPSPQLRIMELQNTASVTATTSTPDVRKNRFTAAVGHLL